jgi:hypothetical protein
MRRVINEETMANPRGSGRNVTRSEEDERYMQRDRERFGWDRDEGYRREEEDHTYGSRNWGYPSHEEHPPRGSSRWGGYEGRYLGQAGQQMEWGNEGYVQGGYDERTYGRGGVQDRYGSQGYQGYRQPSYRGKGPASYVRSDERIREMVCEALTEHEDIDATNIEVAVKGGDVVLSGTVEDRRQKRLAEDLVDQVSGVKDVQNQLRLDERRGR